MSRKAKGRRNTKRGKTVRPLARSRKVAATPKKPKRSGKRLHPDALVPTAVREMSRGRSLAAAARSLKLPSADLQTALKQRGLLKRKGKRWIFKDNLLRRVPVMTGARTRNVIVRGLQQASLVSKHHSAVGAFVRTNNPKFLKPFKGRTVRAANDHEYVLETDPNTLHRIAAMDTPPFHEIYQITSNT